MPCAVERQDKPKSEFLRDVDGCVFLGNVK